MFWTCICISIWCQNITKYDRNIQSVVIFSVNLLLFLVTRRENRILEKTSYREDRAWIYWVDSRVDCLFEHDVSVARGRLSCPCYSSLYIPNTPHVCATPTTAPWGPSCSLSATTGLKSLAPVLFETQSTCMQLRPGPSTMTL